MTKTLHYGGHPPSDVLLQYLLEPSSVDAGDKNIIDGHLTTCARCRAESAEIQVNMTEGD